VNLYTVVEYLPDPPPEWADLYPGETYPTAARWFVVDWDGVIMAHSPRVSGAVNWIARAHLVRDVVLARREREASLNASTQA
jgi:hypothetical protein